jgi:hypothetical protein
MLMGLNLTRLCKSATRFNQFPTPGENARKGDRNRRITMDFCKALEKAFDGAPTDEAREAVQAVIDAHCGDVTTQGGGNGSGPPPPGGGNGSGPPQDP